MIDIIHTWTNDNLRLMGIHFIPTSPDTCVLIVHGMSGSIIEDYYAEVLGKLLATKGVGCIYGHNRGFGHINDIVKRIPGSLGTTTERFGGTYERFIDSKLDINAWINSCKQLGYKKIILLGHSLGCNKVLYFLSKNSSPLITGVVLASPPDAIGLLEKPGLQPNHMELLEEAKRNIRAGNPRKLVSGLIWDWNSLSSQTYSDLYEKGGAIDNFPLMRNPDIFPELAKITVPILLVMGENDDVVIKSIEEDMELIQSKATGTNAFTMKIINDADHVYTDHEDKFAQIVTDWVESI